MMSKSKIKISKPERLPRDGVTDTDLYTWQNELFNYLNQEDDFQLFQKDGRYATWISAETNAKRIIQPVTPDKDEDLPTRQKQLHNYLTIIAGCCYKDQYMVIINQATSLQWIWDELKTIYQITSKGKDFLSIVDIKYDPTTMTAMSIYNSYRAKIMENLKPQGFKVKWKGNTQLLSNETISPTFEDHILISVLQLIDGRLPGKVREVYGPRMEDNKLLMDFKQDILINVPKLIQDIELDNAQLNALASKDTFVNAYMRPKFDKSRLSRKIPKANVGGAFCRLCHLTRRSRDIVTSHEIGDLNCPSLSSRDKQGLRNKLATKLAGATIESDNSDGEVQLDDIAKEYGYLNTTEVKNINNDVPQNESTDVPRHESLECKVSYIKPIPSQILTAFQNDDIIHIDLDSGCWVSCAKLEYVLNKNWDILPNGQLTKLADNKTILKSVGEIEQTFKRNSWTITYRAIVVKELHTDLIGGNNFLKDNKITQNQHKQTITIGDKYTVPETNRSLPLPTKLNSIISCVNSNVILPKQAVNTPVSFPNGSTVLIEPRIENSLKNWPHPFMDTVVNGSITIENQQNQPILLGNSTHRLNIIRVDESTPDLKVYKTAQHQKLQNPVNDTPKDINVNLNVLNDEQTSRLKNILKHNSEVFNKDLLTGYNHQAGKHFCKLNWASTERPPANKVKSPVYSSQLNGLLQQVCDNLTTIGVLGIPQTDDIQVQAVSPCFLRRKQKAKDVPNSKLTVDDVRLVVNSNQVSQYLKNIPTKVTKQQDVFIKLANWKYIIKTDLYQGFFQNHLHPSAYPWCAIQTPYGGLRYFKRSIQGLLGQTEEEDELLAKVLKDQLTKGICVKIADDIFCGGNTIDQALDNFNNVIQRLNTCNLKLSPEKTYIFPNSVDILSWVWNIGGILSPSAHRKKALALTDQESIKTIKDLRSWIGLYKTFLDCTPQLTVILSPFDDVTAGKDSLDPVTWTQQLSTAFNTAKKHIEKMENIYLPLPSDQLIISADAARTQPGLGLILQAKDSHGNIKTVRHYSVKLKKHISKWQPCEIEAAAIGTAIEAFMDYIKESTKPVLICSDSKPVIDAAKKIAQGNFSLSPRMQTFLNNLSKIKYSVHHISGKSQHNAISDFVSRNTFECTAEICQICEFVSSSIDSVVNLNCSITTDLPSLYNRSAWKQIQMKDKACTKAIQCLQSGQTPTKKTGSINSETRRIVKTANIAHDGLIVIRKNIPFSTSTSEKIVVPSTLAPTILTQLHNKSNHPTKSQLMDIFSKHFFSYGISKHIDDLYSSCSFCVANQKLPKQLLQHEVTTNAKEPGSHFGADIMQREGQKILVCRDQFSSYTTTTILSNEKSETLRDGLIDLLTPIRTLNNVIVRTDNAPGFKSLAQSDLHLKKLGITIELGNPNNPNANACVDKAIQELEIEIVKMLPHGGSLNKTTLAQATMTLNSRLRRKGALTAHEILFSRSSETGQNLHLNDDQLAKDQLITRSKANESHNMKIQHKNQTLKYGDIVHDINNTSKHKTRDTYIVTNTSKDNINVQKITNPFDNSKRSIMKSQTLTFKKNQLFKNKAFDIKPKKQIPSTTNINPTWSPIKKNESETDSSDDDESQTQTRTLSMTADEEIIQQIIQTDFTPLTTPTRRQKSRKEIWITAQHLTTDKDRNTAATTIQRWFRILTETKQTKHRMILRKRHEKLNYKEALRSQTTENHDLIPSEISANLQEQDTSNDVLEWDTYMPQHIDSENDLFNEAFLTQPQPLQHLQPSDTIVQGKVYKIPGIQRKQLTSTPEKKTAKQKLKNFFK